MMTIRIISDYKEPALWISRIEGIFKSGNSNNWIYMNLGRGVFMCFNNFTEALSSVFGEGTDVEVYSNKVVLKSGDKVIKEYGNWT